MSKLESLIMSLAAAILMKNYLKKCENIGIIAIPSYTVE